MQRLEHRPVVHLVGSVPLDDAEAVFRSAAETVGPYLKRLPDGETGDRIGWIGLFDRLFHDHPAMEPDPDYPSFDWYQSDGTFVWTLPQNRFKPDIDPTTVTFHLPYAEAAIASYQTFARLQREGTIPADVRFQVSLPTPMAPCYNYISPTSHPTFLAVYEPQIVGEVLRIAEAVPHDKLAIQWDVCQEVLVWEDAYPKRPDDYKEQILNSLQRIGDAVPVDIDLGYHLCYGSPKDEHLVQPKDAGVMVEMLQGLFARIHRPIQFIHLPVPKGRTDDAYFAPLDALELPPGTELYLGLVHHDDLDGDRRRLEAAQHHAIVDGISCECGWGRTDPHRVPGYLASHATIARAMEAK